MERRGEQPWKVNRARVLRDQQTSAEDKLWAKLRARRLGGLKFVRHHPIGPYFVDFACRSHKMVIEVDGGTHCTVQQVTEDERRTADLEARGYRVVRVTNTDIYDSLDGVLNGLLAVIVDRPPVGETQSDLPLSPTLSPGPEWPGERGK